MRHSRVILGLALVCLSLTACGGAESPGVTREIETPAREMSFTADDLGSEWEIGQDLDLDDMTVFQNVEHIRDANMRMFSAADITGLLTSFVFSTKTVKQAEVEMEGDIVESMARDMEQQVPGLTMQTLEAPDLGDEASLSGGTLSDLGLGVYVLTFRKANVVAMFSLIASEDVATEDLVTDYARKLEAKMH